MRKTFDFWCRFSATFFLSALLLSVIIVRNRQDITPLKGLGSLDTAVNSNSAPQILPRLRFTKVSEFVAASISAKQALVVDLESFTSLFAREATAETEPASTTKIATAMVGLQNFSLDQKLITPQSCIGLPGNNLGLAPGEETTFKDLLYAMLLVSDTDATCTVYSNFKGGLPAYVAAMNTYAASLNLTQTNFENPIGFDDGSWSVNISSARDLAILSKSALANPIFKEVVGTKNYVVANDDQKLTRSLVNTNELLGAYPGVFGVKTGNTNLAGQCLVTAVHVRDRDFVIVVLGSSDRFGDSRKLMEWLKSAVAWDNVAVPR